MAISPEHQIYSELFADAPDMAVGFLRDLGVEVPDYDRSELTSCDLGHVDPVERRSDVTIMLRGKVHEDPLGNLMGIVVEVQRDEKERKRFTWPEYVAAMRSKHECPVTLLVICPRQHVADAYNAPIPLGHPGFVLHPLVLGPERIPVITDPAEVGQHPTLGVLSAAAHGPADPDVVKALHTGLDSIDREMATARPSAGALPRPERTGCPCRGRSFARTEKRQRGKQSPQLCMDRVACRGWLRVLSDQPVVRVGFSSVVLALAKPECP